MTRRFIPLFSFSASLLLAFACGIDQQNYRKVAQNSLDAMPAQPVKFSFSIPSRSALGLDAAVLRQKMTGYAWRIEGQGEKCTDSKAHEASGPYEDSRTFAMELSPTCNYLATIMLGTLAESPSALSLASAITYQDQIKPIIDKQCLSCHAEYKDFSGVQQSARSIISSIENERMPPESPLNGASIALFLAWADGGFLEQDPQPKVPTAADKALSSLLYRNNTNDLIMAYELLGRSSFELHRSLWIQPDGEALGLTNDQIFTFKNITAPSGLR